MFLAKAGSGHGGLGVQVGALSGLQVVRNGGLWVPTSATSGSSCSHHEDDEGNNVNVYLGPFSLAYNRIPETGVFIKKRDLFLTVIETEKSQLGGCIWGGLLAGGDAAESQSGSGHHMARAEQTNILAQVSLPLLMKPPVPLHDNSLIH